MLSRKISFFISVVENGSFSKAAKELYVSQSAISQQIIRLEEELNVSLFDRSGYRPVLTKAGKYFYDECKSILEKYKNLEKNTRKLALKENRELRIGITGPIENRHLPSIINEYKKIYSDVLIEIKKINYGDSVNQLEEGKLDVTFGIANEFKMKQNIKKLKLLEHKVCIICSNKHRLSNRESVKSSELKDEPIICFSENLGKLSYIDFIESFKKDGFRPNIIQYVDDLEELLLAVKINKGIAYIGRELIENKNDISILNLENTNHNAYFCIGYLEGNYEKYIQVFVNMTLKHFKKHYKKN